MWALLLFLFYGVIIGGSWYLTNKLKENFPEYKGKILWSVIFFPLMIIVFMGVGGIGVLMEMNSPYQFKPTSFYIIIALVAFSVSISCGYLFFKEYNLLMRLNLDNIPEIKKISTIILGITAFGGIIINPMTAKDSEEIFLSIIILLGMLSLIWYFTNKKIESFKSLLTGENSDITQSYSFAGVSNNDNSNEPKQPREQESAKDKLYKLKELLDKGILTQEEFETMKKNILEKGI